MAARSPAPEADDGGLQHHGVGRALNGLGHGSGIPRDPDPTATVRPNPQAVVARPSAVRQRNALGRSPLANTVTGRAIEGMKLRLGLHDIDTRELPSGFGPRTTAGDVVAGLDLDLSDLPACARSPHASWPPGEASPC